MTGQQPHAVPVPQGYRVGHWEIREPLASGSFATVYAGRPTGEADPALPRRAALKFLPTGTRTPRQLRHLRELAEREVEVLARLRAPRLIRMYETLTVDDPDHPELDGATVIVLERAEGSLDAVLEHDPKPESGPVMLAQVCEGLRQLHRAGWVHGDLKPANVLLMKDASVRLADFNMAAELDGTHAYAPAFATPDYTPPELLWPEMDERGARIRPSADTWAFGVLAHLVLTGTFPMPGGSTQARTDAVTRYAHGTEELRLSAELPDPWREIILACLAPTHTERITADALLRRVERAVHTPRSGRLPRLRPRPWHRHPVVTAMLATALVLPAALVGGAYVHVNHDDGTPVYEALPAAARAPISGDGKVSVGYDRCPQDSVCFFSEHNGWGDMCSWRGDDTNWQAGEEVCEWAADGPVRSVFNNLAGNRRNHDVAYYRGTDFEAAGYDRSREAQRTGCDRVNSMDNLAGTYAPRSHRLVDSCASGETTTWGRFLSLFD
ncbi:serine/threonine-protein kinase [Streptomyces sp. NPDC093982]|uniref:serine/threonine-protein kinase n=1 Tax=Streptomyces sp. NPDC093982 TaxID=3155077 RepID=UPI00342EBCEA